MAARTVGVVLAGCGRADGSEVHESTLSLLYITHAGASWRAFAPDALQARVVNHLTGEPAAESRNQLAEAARIARGQIADLAAADPDALDALVLPGGAGAGENLADGPDGVQGDLLRLIRGMRKAGKPIGAICIMPTVLAAALKDSGLKLTCGNVEAAAEKIRAAGCQPVPSLPRDCVINRDQKIASASAYLYEPSPQIHEVAVGIQKCIEAVLAMCACV